MQIATLNVTSLPKRLDTVLNFANSCPDLGCLILQETRIPASRVNSLTLRARNAGWDLLVGHQPPIRAIKSDKASLRQSWGGLAALVPRDRFGSSWPPSTAVVISIWVGPSRKSMYATMDSFWWWEIRICCVKLLPTKRSICNWWAWNFAVGYFQFCFHFWHIPHSGWRWSPMCSGGFQCTYASIGFQSVVRFLCWLLQIQELRARGHLLRKWVGVRFSGFEKNSNRPSLFERLGKISSKRSKHLSRSSCAWSLSSRYKIRVPGFPWDGFWA